MASLGRAGLLFAVFYGLYYFVLSGSGLHLWYLETVHSSCSWLLNVIGLEHEASWNKYDQRGLLKTDVWAEVGVDKRSDGMLELSLLLAAVVAWAVAIPRKLLFVVLAVLMVFAIVVMRLTAGLYVEHYAPLRYEMFVTWISPTVLLLAVMLLFLLYVRKSR